ncbi:hypothetical protein IC762_30420 [Bradyrhizobium genosp. L]|uniref:hypothetical protein n=1 Tax=Bradyrhizobium genosp. L TaxID=83637 RepID=UPI0018A291E6|nr:hypothetical protein [Bradyrhizobium genosp. L]QPF83927.1 hypothetical protein IC762_30420 [Bradyrhizobium genosp. L]
MLPVTATIVPKVQLDLGSAIALAPGSARPKILNDALDSEPGRMADAELSDNDILQNKSPDISSSADNHCGDWTVPKLTLGRWRQALPDVSAKSARWPVPHRNGRAFASLIVGNRL